MGEAGLERSARKVVTVRRGAVLVALAAFAVALLAPTGASAQITPVSYGANDFCADERAGFGSTPRGTFRVSIQGAGKVTAAMWKTGADCILTNRTGCTTNCDIVAQPVCEFHCYHFHTSPHAWPVQFTATADSGSTFVGWQAGCEPTRDASRRDCILRWSREQTLVHLTAVFVPAEQADTLAPSPAPSLAVPTVRSYDANLTWTASNDQWPAGYDIYRGATQVARVSPGTTNYALKNLLCNTAYTLRVDAFDYSGNEARSTEVAIRTGACPSSGGTTGARPNTEIHVKPRKRTRAKRAFFHFGQRGEVRARKFQCKLDKRRWTRKRCSARDGITYRRLKPGRHVFRVRAGNANGWDPTPARYIWRIRR